MFIFFPAIDQWSCFFQRRILADKFLTLLKDLKHCKYYFTVNIVFYVSLLVLSLPMLFQRIDCSRTYGLNWGKIDTFCEVSMQNVDVLWKDVRCPKLYGIIMVNAFRSRRFMNICYERKKLQRCKKLSCPMWRKDRDGGSNAKNMHA